MRIDEALAVPVVAGWKSRRGRQNQAPAGARTAVVAPSRHASAVCAMLAAVRDGALYQVIRKAGLQNLLYTSCSFGDLLRATTFEVVEAWRYGWLPRNRLSRLPAFMSEASAGVAIINSIDAGLERALTPFCQNWAFVLRKRPVPTER